MKTLEKIEIIGDSILKGVQVNPISKRYYTKNEMDLDLLSSKYLLTIKNDSKFGCTVTKGYQIITSRLDKGMECDVIVMDFGGNDCDFKWQEIASDPSKSYEPNVPLPTFRSEYIKLIRVLKDKHIIPIITTLPPLEPQRFFDWWCQNLNKSNVLKWLGSVEKIYNHQASYSMCVKEIAQEENIPLVDLRSAFLEKGDIKNLLCEDGTHPNSSGQKVIIQAFQDFISSRPFFST